MRIRPAQPEDIAAMVGLSDRFRKALSGYSSVFWRMADDATDKQTAWFQILLSSPNAITLVAEAEAELGGFVIANMQAAPPVYAPGGPVCLIDDFCIAADAKWSAAGSELLAAVEAEARNRGAVVSIVICPHLAAAKRDFLAERGFAVAAEWHVRDLGE